MHSKYKTEISSKVGSFRYSIDVVVFVGVVKYVFGVISGSMLINDFNNFLKSVVVFPVVNDKEIYRSNPHSVFFVLLSNMELFTVVSCLLFSLLTKNNSVSS